MMAAARSLDPGRDLRLARAEFEFTPTAQDQAPLAAALLQAGAADEAARNDEACLKGPFAMDLDVPLYAARASFESGQAARPITHLEQLGVADGDLRTEQVGRLPARALSTTGGNAGAKAPFEFLLSRFNCFDAQTESAIRGAFSRDAATLARREAQIAQAAERWGRRTRELGRALLRRGTRQETTPPTPGLI